ncbi:MAG TPA: SCO family protein [Steroidobacteraceae bacterium]|nr:SCO family protein [Steroidobacteraceae bacterium]
MSKRYWWVVAVVAVAAAIAGVVVGRLADRESAPALQSGTALPTPKVLADFALVDATGAPASLNALRGHPTLVFFGFTHCPDVCPTTLAILADVQKQVIVDDRLAGLKVALISVDPERDTPAAMEAYLKSFGGDLIGLTGPAPEIVRVSRTFGVASSKVDLGGGNYTMDHSATIFAVDAAGRVVAIFTPPFRAAALKADVATLAPLLSRGRS